MPCVRLFNLLIWNIQTNGQIGELWMRSESLFNNWSPWNVLSWIMYLAFRKTFCLILIHDQYTTVSFWSWLLIISLSLTLILLRDMLFRKSNLLHLNNFGWTTDKLSQHLFQLNNFLYWDKRHDVVLSVQPAKSRSTALKSISHIENESTKTFFWSLRFTSSFILLTPGVH